MSKYILTTHYYHTTSIYAPTFETPFSMYCTDRCSHSYYMYVGPSMFYWCWVSVGTTVVNRKRRQQKIVLRFAMVSLFLYYFWHFVFWIFSLCVLITAAWIIRGHLTASSETRKFVLKQNFIYVLVLGIETCLILPIWVAQLSITKNRVDTFHPDNSNNYYPYYLTYTDLGLAIAFAVIHSLRGTIDFFVWLGTFTVSYSDIKYLRYTLRKKYLKRYHSERVVASSMLSPVIKRKDSAVNRTLRRNAIYCINIGILDAIQLHLEQSKPARRSDSGAVRIEEDCYMDAVLLQSDEGESESNAMHKFPKSGEQSLRRIQFPSSSLLGISSFSFIDLEPSVFSMLRDCYGIDPRNYRASFRIKNAADIESSGMLEKFTEGKSGSFFYFTRDFKYIIKTVTDEEEKFLQKIAYRYYDHMKNNPNSLIVRFFGLHKVRLAREQRYITVVVMENIFHTPDQFKMHERYDLKGSRIGRRSVKKTSKVRREYKGTLKDLDLGDKKIHVGADSKAQLMGQLRRDVEFLVQCKIMDYSLLLGIHNHNGAQKSSRAMVREGSIRGRGDDFVDVDIENGSGLHRTGTGSASLKSFRDRLSSNKSRTSGYSTRSNTVDSTSESTKPLVVNSDGDIVESQFYIQQEQIAWFREDYGGLRSTSPLHPLYKEELQFRGPSVYFDQEQEASNVQPATYYFGIVDILQQYNWRKKSEHFWKTKFACQDKHGISCVNEREYGERFLNFMDEIFQ